MLGAGYFDFLICKFQTLFAPSRSILRITRKQYLITHYIKIPPTAKSSSEAMAEILGCHYP